MWEQEQQHLDVARVLLDDLAGMRDGRRVVQQVAAAERHVQLAGQPEDRQGLQLSTGGKLGRTGVVCQRPGEVLTLELSRAGLLQFVRLQSWIRCG